jgi:1-acyl-sn-glycerol-3-phosphate acyltransferase
MQENKLDIESVLDKIPRKVGSYGYDAWGFNLKGIKPFLKTGRFFYEKYFKVECLGLENIPKDGRVLIIANHTGQLPIDATLLGYAIITNPNAPRAPKGMYERFIPTMPFFSQWFSMWGGTLGDPENCERMLENEEAIMVFPEGARGISKPTSKKYQLQRFGNGFMHLALKCNTPIIPVGIAGCEEIMFNYGNIDFLQKILRFPAAPLLVPFIFPSKVILNFGKPMYFKGDVDVMKEHEIEEYVNEVKNTIHVLTQEGLKVRNSKI